METKEVKTSVGVFVLKEPNAGIRNKALIAAETNEGFRATVFLNELMPKCILKRPEDMSPNTPIEDILNSLSIQDYDLLTAGVNYFLKKMVPELSEETNEIKKE